MTQCHEQLFPLSWEKLLQESNTNVPNAFRIFSSTNPILLTKIFVTACWIDTNHGTNAVQMQYELYECISNQHKRSTKLKFVLHSCWLVIKWNRGITLYFTFFICKKIKAEQEVIQFYYTKIPLHLQKLLVVSFFLIRFVCRNIWKISKMKLLITF